MVYDSNSIDIMAKKKDCSIVLIIITENGLDESVEQQTLLMDKIENYMAYLNGQDFREEFPDVADDKRRIILEVDKQPSEMMEELLEKITNWVNSEGIHFSVKRDYYDSMN